MAAYRPSNSSCTNGGSSAATSDTTRRSSVSAQSGGTAKYTPSVSASSSVTPRAASSAHMRPSVSRPRRVTSLAACTSAKRVRSPPAARYPYAELTTIFMADDMPSYIDRSAEPGGAARRCGRRARLRREPRFDESIDERQGRAEVVAIRSDPKGAHERWIQARDVGLHDAMRNTGSEEVQRGAAVHRAVAGFVRGQCS